MTNNIEKLNSEELEREYLNYYSYINSSGIHGAEKQKAILDFIFSATQKAFQAGQESKAEEIRGEIEKMKFKMDVKDYLPLVKIWTDGYDQPFDSGYAQAKKDILSTLSTPNNEIK